MIESYYKTLNLPVGAGVAEIRNAYRRLAMRLHPDRGGDPVEFQNLSNAYANLVEWAARRSRPSPVFTSITVTLEQLVASEDKVLVVAPDGNPRWITIKLRPDISHGQELRYTNIEGLDTDLFVTVNIAEHPRFKKLGLDLYTTADVSALELIVGGSITVTTLYNKTIRIEIPELSSADSVLRLAKQGVATASQCGDLYVRIRSVLPKLVSPELKAAILQELHLHKGTSECNPTQNLSI